MFDVIYSVKSDANETTKKIIGCTKISIGVFGLCKVVDVGIEPEP